LAIIKLDIKSDCLSIKAELRCCYYDLHFRL